MGYKWVKRANWEQYADMLTVVAVENEIQQLEHSDDPYTANWHYKISRAGAGHDRAYTIQLWDGDKLIEVGGFARCDKCGAIRELWEGQGEYCLECWQDWE